MPDTNSQYGQGWGQSPYVELTCPTGAKCLVKRLEPLDLIAQNLFGTGDAMGALIQKKVKELSNPALTADQVKSKQNEIDQVFEQVRKSFSSVLGGGGQVGEVIDQFIVYAVVAPTLVLPPKDPADREVGIIYTDTVKFEDKMYIFSQVMEGVSALRRFPGEGSERLGAVDHVQDVPLPAE